MFIYVLTENTRERDSALARRLTAIVLCWFPIGLLGLLASKVISIPRDWVNVAMAIFVLLLNSALNPFLYTSNQGLA
nr:hypothetical protein BaRGS_024459 [Batillaria attramentaria]